MPSAPRTTTPRGHRDTWTDAADGWRSVVTLDGEDVSLRCRSILWRGEHPVAVELFAGASPMLDLLGEPINEIRCGRIEVRGLHRLAAAIDVEESAA
jgi:hypothetical protein